MLTIGRSVAVRDLHSKDSVIRTLPEAFSTGKRILYLSRSESNTFCYSKIAEKK
jgi:hypothetical protein